MNILVVSTTYFPLLGGSETHTRTLCSSLVLEGHNVTVITHQPLLSFPKFEVLDGVRIFRIGDFIPRISDPNKVAWEEAFFGHLDEIKKIVNGTHFHIIHCQNQASLLIGTFLKYELSCPLVVSFHETTPETEAFGLSRSRGIVENLPYDMIIAGSNYFKNQALAFGADKAKVRVVYCCMRPLLAPSLPRDEIRRKLNIPCNSFLLLSVGRFKERKQQHLLVEATIELAKKMPDIHLCLVGSCNSASEEYFNRVRKSARLNLRDQQYSILKDLPDHDLGSLIYASDLGLLISQQEGLGLSILEFLAANIIVVAADIPGINEIITDRVNGFLVTPTIQDIVKKIGEARTDEALQSTIKSNLPSTVRKFDPKQLTKDTVKLYQELIGN